MANVVCTWELGANLGHLANLKQVAAIAIAKGHDVWMIVRDLRQAHVVLGDLPVRLLQAPVKHNVATPSFDHMLCYSQLIRHYSYSDRHELLGYIRAWRDLFTLIKPDVVFYDHCPVALIASLGERFKKVVIGSGFTLPPTQTPLFGVFPTTQSSDSNTQLMITAERALLEDVAFCLGVLKLGKITQVADIYRQADDIVRLTIPELDHFGPRPRGRYVGIWPSFGVALAQWGEGATKAFAYLQPFKGLPVLLRELAAEQVSTLVYSPKLAAVERQKLSSQWIQFTDQPLDLNTVAGEISFAITHGNHDTTAHFLLNGVPQLVIPRHQEQLFLSLQYTKQGLGRMAFQDQPSYQQDIRALLDGDEFRHKSRVIQARYGGSDALATRQYFYDIMETL